jgi:hypothetical protein
MFSIFQLWTYHSSKWPPICSIFRNHYPILFSFMTYHCVCNQINTTGATCGERNAYPSWALEFTSVFGFLCNALKIIVNPCVFFLLTIVLSVLLWFTVHTPFGSFKLFLQCVLQKNREIHLRKEIFTIFVSFHLYEQITFFCLNLKKKLLVAIKS